jgi:AcrR family transcriptional regulator
MKTKEKILVVALEMFNATNTQAATTNHIAKEMGISIGNLHYHYKNREEIIRHLYEQYRTKMTADGAIRCIRQLEETHKNAMNLLWEYRFFQRELLFLLSRDPLLKKKYIEDNIAHRSRIVQSMHFLVEEGILDIPFDNVIEHLADTILLTVQFWNPFLLTLDIEPTKENIERSILHIRQAMRPYLTSKAIELISKISD